MRENIKEGLQKQLNSEDAENLKVTGLFKTFYFFFFSAMSYLSLIPIFWSSKGIDEVKIGLLSSLRPLICFWASPLMSFFADYLHIHNQMLLVCIVLGVAVRYFILTKPFFFALLFSISISSLVDAPISPIMDASLMKHLKDVSEYGKIRLYGALGFGLFSFIAGAILSSTPFGWAGVFIMYWLSMLMCFIISLYIFILVPKNKMLTAKIKDHTFSTVTYEEANDKNILENLHISKKESSKSLLIGDLLNCCSDLEQTLEVNDENLLQNVHVSRKESSKSLLIGDLSNYCADLEETPSQFESHNAGATKEGDSDFQFSVRRRSVTIVGSEQHTSNNGETDRSGINHKSRVHKIGNNCWDCKIIREIWQLLQVRETFIFFLVIFFAGCSAGIIESFLYVYTKSLGGSEMLMGFARAITCAAEIPVFHFSNSLLEKCGEYGTITIAVLVYSIRLGYYSYLHVLPIWALIPGEILHGFTFAALWAASTSFGFKIAPMHLKTTVQGCISGIHHGIGLGFGSLIGGYIYQEYGPVVLFRGMSIVMAMVFVVMLIDRISMPNTLSLLYRKLHWSNNNAYWKQQSVNKSSAELEGQSRTTNLPAPVEKE